MNTAKDKKENEILWPKFNGRNYGSWDKKMKANFKILEMTDIVEDGAPIAKIKKITTYREKLQEVNPLFLFPAALTATQLGFTQDAQEEVRIRNLQQATEAAREATLTYLRSPDVIKELIKKGIEIEAAIDKLELKCQYIIMQTLEESMKTNEYQSSKELYEKIKTNFVQKTWENAKFLNAQWSSLELGPNESIAAFYKRIIDLKDDRQA